MLNNYLLIRLLSILSFFSFQRVDTLCGDQFGICHHKKKRACAALRIGGIIPKYKKEILSNIHDRQ